jgi:hypothetical protein
LVGPINVSVAFDKVPAKHFPNLDFSDSTVRPFAETTGEATSSKSIYAHELCCLWSPQCWTESQHVCGVATEVKRSYRLICSLCHKRGASVGCQIARCKKQYHLHCAQASGCQLIQNGFKLFCADHSHGKTKANPASNSLMEMFDSEQKTETKRQKVKHVSPEEIQKSTLNHERPSTPKQIHIPSKPHKSEQQQTADVINTPKILSFLSPRSVAEPGSIPPAKSNPNQELEQVAEITRDVDATQTLSSTGTAFNEEPGAVETQSKSSHAFHKLRVKLKVPIGSQVSTLTSLVDEQKQSIVTELAHIFQAPPADRWKIAPQPAQSVPSNMTPQFIDLTEENSDLVLPNDTLAAPIENQPMKSPKDSLAGMISTVKPGKPQSWLYPNVTINANPTSKHDPIVIDDTVEQSPEITAYVGVLQSIMPSASIVVRGAREISLKFNEVQ